MNEKKLRFSTENDINNYIRKNQQSVYEDLIKTWRKNIDDSNKLLNEITNNKVYLENNTNEVEESLEILNSALDYYSELGINFDSIGIMRYGIQEMRRNLEKNYRHLSFKYYQYMFEKSKNETEESTKKNSEIEEKINQTEEKINNMDNRLESLGGIFLNIVLTISIVSSMVAVLLNAKPGFAISIVLTCAWLLLSSILFISEYYKNSEKNKRFTFGRNIYIFLTIITFASYIPHCIDYYNNNLTRKLSSQSFFIENNSIPQYIVIENPNIVNDFLDSFSPYWKENEENYIVFENNLKKNNISKIIFYKFANGNVDLYKYEIILSNDEMVSLKIREDDLKQWLNKNDLIIE